MSWVRCVACTGEMRNAYKIVVGKKLLGRPRLGGKLILK
jgi:hypothetical protein